MRPLSPSFFSMRLMAMCEGGEAVSVAVTVLNMPYISSATFHTCHIRIYIKFALVSFRLSTQAIAAHRSVSTSRRAKISTQCREMCCRVRVDGCAA